MTDREAVEIDNPDVNNLAIRRRNTETTQVADATEKIGGAHSIRLKTSLP